MKKQNKKILITGGAGYIGLNLVHFFIKEKYQVYVVDNLSTSQPINKLIKKKIKFYKVDLRKESSVELFFKNKNFDLIIHLAAFSGVKEFNKDVKKSFNNNILSTRNIIRFGFKNLNTKFVFASSAAVYGKVSQKKVNEKNKCAPINYYGLSKLACEKIVHNELKNKKVHYAILRYFNVVGSILNFKIDKKIKSLFDIVSNNVKRKNYRITINGRNHKTKDGTPERDFIHVEDLCEIHKRIYMYLKKNRNIILNCGSGTRFSVLEIVREFEKMIKKKINNSYKIINPDETKTICADVSMLNNLLKIRVKKNKISHYLLDYL